MFDYQGQAKKRIISIEYTIKSEYTAFIESICYEVKSEINGIVSFKKYSSLIEFLELIHILNGCI